MHLCLKFKPSKYLRNRSAYCYRKILPPQIFPAVHVYGIPELLHQVIESCSPLRNSSLAKSHILTQILPGDMSLYLSLLYRAGTLYIHTIFSNWKTALLVRSRSFTWHNTFTWLQLTRECLHSIAGCTAGSGPKILPNVPRLFSASRVQSGDETNLSWFPISLWVFVWGF